MPEPPGIIEAEQNQGPSQIGPDRRHRGDVVPRRFRQGRQRGDSLRIGRQLGPEVPRGEIDGVRLDHSGISVVHEDRGHRIEPDAPPVPAAHQGRACGRVGGIVKQHGGPAQVVERSLPTRDVPGDPTLQLHVPLVQVGADDFEPGVGEDLAPGAMLILVK